MAAHQLPTVCAQVALMEPWVTLDVTKEKLLAACRQDHERLRYVMAAGETLIGTVMFRVKNANAYLAARGGAGALLEHHNVSSEEALPDAAYINILAVFPPQQGKAHGAQLLQFAETQCAPHVPHLYLCVSDFNVAARRFYEIHGYTEVGRIPDCIKRGYAEIIMLKAISAGS